MSLASLLTKMKLKSHALLCFKMALITEVVTFFNVFKNRTCNVDCKC